MKNILPTLLFLLSLTGFAQVEKTSALHVQMKQFDSIVFEAGFNNCNLKALEKVLAEDLEFYHDVGGVQNKTEFLEAMAQNICGNPSVKITRELIPESLRVFPLKSNDSLYGVFLRGEHEFYQQKTDEARKKTGYARFSSYWELQKGVWKLKRAFSFDHKAAH